MIKHLSLFSGLGGASSALKQAGLDFETLAISEISPKSLSVYKAIHGHVPHNEKDIIAFADDPERLRFYTENEIPDLITGGFPCQPFSGMNLKKKKDLMDDVRYQAALAMRDIVNIIQPKYVLLENVRDITNKTFWPQIRKFLGGFNRYTYVIDMDNPIRYGHFQSRTRNYILMTHDDQIVWRPGQMKTRHRKFKFSKSPSKDQYYVIGAPRVEAEVDIDDPKFACLAARSCNAHCSRFTWIPLENGRGHRAPTADELFQMFGYRDYPRIRFSSRGGVSRSAAYYAFGNSWHVAHAASHFSTLPIK
jgi:site-specific DNA-cytosine methylase